MNMNTFRFFAVNNNPLNETPLWNGCDGFLYWRGINGEAYRKKYSGKPSSHSTPEAFECYLLDIGKIGGMVFMDNGDLLLFAWGAKVWQWKPGNRPVHITTLPDATASTLFNDVIAGPDGSVYCGVLGTDFNKASKRPDGSLWRFDRDGHFEIVEHELGVIPNGLRFSPDLRYLYFAISDRGIFRYRYHRQTGALDQKEKLVDADGCLWSALWGPEIAVYSPTGDLVRKLPLPSGVRGASSITFGGCEYRTIFVTTHNYPQDGKAGSFAGGGVLWMDVTATGLRDFPSGFERQPCRQNDGA